MNQSPYFNIKNPLTNFATILVLTLYAMLGLSIIYSCLKKYYDKYQIKRNKLNHIKKAIRKYNENESMDLHAREGALAKAVIKSDKHWTEQRDISKEELQKLQDLLEAMYSDKRVTLTETQILQAPSLPPKRIYRYAKKQLSITPVQPSPDDIVIWSDRFPSYNLTRNISVDVSNPVYRLSSGNRFVFVNIYLAEYLKLNHPETLQSLLHLCSRGRDHLPNHSKNQSGFIIREEMNAHKIDKTLKAQPKQEAKNGKTFYIKGKVCEINARVFGSSIATVKGMTLFEINGWKTRHKDRQITYFPSEANNTSYKI